jgi:predicted acylesterase/phospholipase RssA
MENTPHPPRDNRSVPESGQPFRVFSFPGAGLDTVLHMGLVHAMLVTRRKAPDMVAGISVGAITATALADVLHTGDGSTEDDERRVARFNELLESFRNAPDTVLKGFFPDPLETNSAHALKPVELPRHFQEERDSRRAAVVSRTGLIRLFDQLLRIRVTVRLVAQISRVLMGWTETGEMEPGQRLRTRCGLIFRLWWLVARNILSLSTPVSLLARVQAADLLGFRCRQAEEGVEAGHIIFKKKAWLRALRDGLLWLLLGFLPLLCLLGAVPVLVLALLTSLFFPAWSAAFWTETGVGIFAIVGPACWLGLFLRGKVAGNFLKYFQIYQDLGDSHALKEALVHNFDPTYYGDFDFDGSVRRAIAHQSPAEGHTRRRTLGSFAEPGPGGDAIRVSPIAANLGTGKLETLPPGTPVVDALMCACASAPFFKAQTIHRPDGPATFIDGITVSNDPIVPVFEEACRLAASQPEKGWSSLRIISAPLLPVRQEKNPGCFEPYTGLVDVALRARELQRFQDMLLDKSLIDRLSRALNGRAATISDESGQTETLLPAKIRLVAPERAPKLSLRLLQASNAAKQREIIDTAVADGCRAMIERLVTDALPDTRTPEERRLLLEPDEDLPDEWPHRNPEKNATLRAAVDALRTSGQTVTRSDGREYVSCRKLLAAWGGLEPIPGSTADGRAGEAGPGISAVCRCCVTCGSSASEPELRRHIRLPRITPTPFVPIPPPADPVNEPAVVFLFSGGVFRGVFQVGFANAVSELGIQPDVIAGSSVGTIVGALTGRVFQRPAGLELLERQRQMRRLAATFLTIDRFVLTDRFADFIRHFSIHAAAADFSPHDLDLVFRRYENDLSGAFSRRARRVFSGLERLFYLSPFEVLELTRMLRAGNWQEAARVFKALAQEVVDRYGVGVEILGPEPLQQLIDGFVFDGKAHPEARFDHFGFPLIGTTTNLTLGQLEILRSTHAWSPRFTQSLLAGSAFPSLFRPRWSWEVYRHPGMDAQYSDGGIMDNLPLGAVVEYLWGKDGNAIYARRPDVPHLILTATLEAEKADWTQRDNLEELSWHAIRARAKQLRYNGKIGKFQQSQRDIRRIIQQRSAENDPDVHSLDLPLNLDVLAVKPRWVCGSFAFHPMLGFSRQNQTASIAHGCASTICAVADHFQSSRQIHAVDSDALRRWAVGRGIALDQLPEREQEKTEGPLAYGPAPLSPAEQEEGQCWFRRPDTTGKRPVCPFHAKSPAAKSGDEVSPELQKIYFACGNRATHEPRRA